MFKKKEPHYILAEAAIPQPEYTWQPQQPLSRLAACSQRFPAGTFALVASVKGGLGPV